MGFEFRIKTSLTPGQRQHIATLLEAREPAPAGTSKMPAQDIALQEDGLYICQYLSRDPWHGLATLRAYFIEQAIAHSVQEIDD